MINEMSPHGIRRKLDCYCMEYSWWSNNNNYKQLDGNMNIVTRRNLQCHKLGT